MIGSRTTSVAGSRWLRYRPVSRPVAGPFAVAALVNVALLFILFLVWSSRVVLQPGMVIELPLAPFYGGAPYGRMVLAITPDGQTYFNDIRTPVARLGPALIEAAARNPEVCIAIEADARVPFATVVRVMNLAAAAGFKRVNLAVRPSFGEENAP